MKALLTLLTITLMCLASIPAFAEDPVYFADDNLKAAVEAQLGKTDPTPTDMLGLTYLWAGNSGIIDLTGLEYATNLTSLKLYGNQISDISALSGLTSLQELYLYKNQISDISPLSGLTNLQQLELDNNQISDISPLSGLTSLWNLKLEWNRIGDISALSGLTNLIILNLESNQISDISVLSGHTKLSTLDLSRNQISDISALSGLTNLFNLTLHNNQISDISALSGLTNLHNLYLTYNQISDVSVLSGHVKLQNLYLNNNQISDISWSGLTSLRWLHLENNQISNISLSGLASVQRVYLENNQISNISLSNLPSLFDLVLYNNQISDISTLSGLTALRTLQLQNNQISDISALSGLTGLEGLHLHNNQISDISALSGLTSLRGLNLHYNQISDISALSGLTDPYHINLNNNQVSDISPLIGLTSLRYLYLLTNPLDCDAYNIHIPMLQAQGTSVYYDPPVWLTLTISSTAGGLVTEPGEGDFDYTNHTIVSINAVADVGYLFENWTGTAVNAGKVVDPGSAGTTVAMEDDYTLVANFFKVNLPPVADAGPDQIVEQTSIDGADVQLDGSGSYDPDEDPLTYEWTWEGGSASGATPLVLLPTGLTTITLTVYNNELFDEDTVNITVHDTIPPDIYIYAPQPYELYSVGDLALDFLAIDTTCEPQVSGTLSDAAGYSVPVESGSVVVVAGVYNLLVSAIDDAGNDSESEIFFVVYDPEGGFVTGGGWIDSPAGAYQPDPFLTGKANFGFVSKYKRGATTPTGNTEFVFRAAELNFHSSSYEWLVVTGSDYARFKGWGTINGEGDYRFMLWAGDDPDTFRIRIWEEDEISGVETDVYDNGFDQGIGGGSIVIHAN